jgi:hypothetical protein
LQFTHETEVAGQYQPGPLRTQRGRRRAKSQDTSWISRAAFPGLPRPRTWTACGNLLPPFLSTKSPPSFPPSAPCGDVPDV